MTVEERLNVLEQRLADMEKGFRTEKLSVVDEEGRARVEVTAGKSGPILTLLDDEGRKRIALGIVKNGPVVALLDENGLTSLTLDTNRLGPKLHMFNEHGEFRVGLTVAPDSGPRLMLGDMTGGARAVLEVSDDAQVLTLQDENGKFRVGLGMPLDREEPSPAGLVLKDRDSSSSVVMEAADGNGAKVLLSDEDGNTIWSAP